MQTRQTKTLKRRQMMDHQAAAEVSVTLALAAQALLTSCQIISPKSSALVLELAIELVRGCCFLLVACLFLVTYYLNVSVLGPKCQPAKQVIFVYKLSLNIRVCVAEIFWRGELFVGIRKVIGSVGSVLRLNQIQLV